MAGLDSMAKEELEGVAAEAVQAIPGQKQLIAHIPIVMEIHKQTLLHITIQTLEGQVGQMARMGSLEMHIFTLAKMDQTDIANM